MFLVKEKHPEIDLFGIYYWSLRGIEILNPNDGENEGAQVEDDQEVTINDLFDVGKDTVVENLIDPTVDMSALHPLVIKSVPTKSIPNEFVIVASESIPNVIDLAAHPTDV